MENVLRLKAGEFIDPEDKRKVLVYAYFGVGEKEEYGYPLFNGFLLREGNEGKKQIIDRITEDPEFRDSEDKRVLVYILEEEAYREYLLEAKNEKDPEGEEDATDNDIEIANEEPITLYLTLDEYLLASPDTLYSVFTRNESPDEIKEGEAEGKSYPYRAIGEILSPEEREAFKAYLRV